MTKEILSYQLMRTFLEAKKKNIEKKIKVPQNRFQIIKNRYKIKPESYFKEYKNTNILSKRLYNPLISLKNTYPIGSIKFHD